MWHAGDEQPPGGYVNTGEQKAHPKNKSKKYDIYSPPPPTTSGKKSNKKKGGAGGKTTPELPKPQAGKPIAPKAKPLNKTQAGTAAAQAPTLMETAETEALSAATEMGRAAAPSEALAASKAAADAAGRSKASEVALSELLVKVAAFDEIAADVRLYHTSAAAAAAAAAKFAAQAKRLAEVADAERRVKEAGDQLGAERAKLETARKLEAELGQEIDYLESYYPVLRQGLAATSSQLAGDAQEMQAQVLAGIVQASRERGNAQKEIEDLKASVAAMVEQEDLAKAEVPVKTEAAVVGGAGLSEDKATLEERRSLRDLAGGEANLSTLLALPKFGGSQTALKPYLQAVSAQGLKKPNVVQLISQLSDTRTDVELSTLAKAVADGAGCDVTIKLAKTDPSISAAHVSLFAKVQTTAKCKAQVVVDLLPVRVVPAYATEPILVELAQLAAGGPSASLMAQIIVAEPALPKDDLIELTEVFDDYPGTDDILLLAKMLKEGMRGGRKAAELTSLIENLNERGTELPAASDLKSVLQATSLAAFAITELGQLMTSVAGLTGQQMAETGTWLAPLTPTNQLFLIDVFVSDSTPVLAIYETFQILNKARLNGTAISDKVKYLRGYLAAPGGDADESITEVGGRKILTGPEIHAHALNALSGDRPHLKVAGLNKYPKGEDPNARSLGNLWLDANPTARGDETAEEAVRRQKLAIAQLCAQPDYSPNIVQQLLAHDHGAAPRAIKLPAAEDALDPAAHTNDKHVIGGGGSVDTWYRLAARACFSPSTKGKATAFRSPAQAQEAIQAALDSYVAGGSWSYLRDRMCKGFAVAIDEPVATDKCVWLETTAGPNAGPNGLYTRNGDGSFIYQNAKPKYDGGKGGRRYYPGDTGVFQNQGGYITWRTKPTVQYETFGDAEPNRIPVENATLTTVVPATGIHLRLVGANVDGGFTVNSAYAY